MKLSKKYFQLGLLLALFLLPLIAAWYVNRQEIFFGTTNYGSWVKPNLMWENTSRSSKRVWKILFYVSGKCDAICLEKLDQLARVRLAMGRKVYDLDIHLVMKSSQSNTSLTDLLNKQAIKLEIVENLDGNWVTLFNQHPLALLDEQNKAVLTYPLNFDSKKLYHDLQHLIH